MAQKEKNDLKADPSSIKQTFVPFNLNLHCCRYWKLSEWEYSNLSFSFWRLYYNSISGAKVHFKGKDYLLDSSKVFLIPPFTSFSTSLRKSGNEGLKGNRIESAEELDSLRSKEMVDHFFIHFNLGIHFDQIEPNVFEIEIDEKTRHIIDTIRLSIIENYTKIDLAQTLKISTLVYNTLSCIDNSLWKERTTDKRVIKTLGFIDQHFQEQLSNEYLSGMANMATNSFLRLFKESMGITIQRYIQKVRIDKAILEMHHAVVSIDQVASKCGFNDRHHFSKVFKRVTGLPPAQYRQLKIYY